WAFPRTPWNSTSRRPPAAARKRFLISRYLSAPPCCLNASAGARDRMARSTDISDAAAQWLIRLEGQTSPEIWDTFQTWMDESPRHRAAFIRLREAWHQVDLLKNMRPTDGTIDSDLLAPTRINPAAILAEGLQPIQLPPRPRAEDVAVPERRRVLA